MPLRFRLIFGRCNRLINRSYKSIDILIDYKRLIEQNIITEEKYLLNCPRTEKLVNQNFKPSKTAQNCLNFITKKDELELINTSLQHPDLIDIFKIILILIKEDYAKIGIHKIPNYLFSQKMPQLKIDSLSKFLI